MSQTKLTRGERYGEYNIYTKIFNESNPQNFNLFRQVTFIYYPQRIIRSTLLRIEYSLQRHLIFDYIAYLKTAAGTILYNNKMFEEEREEIH